MNLYGNFKSPLGYQTGESQIDTYGVDHSGFSTRDELEYQFARQDKENQLIQNYNNQGITKNYPQYGTNFWGGSSNDNYGFGFSNIHDNIEKRNNNPFENMVNTFGQNQTEQSYSLENSNQNQSLSWPQSYRLGSENQTFGQENNNSTQWGLNNTPLAQNNNNNTLSGNLFGNNNLFNQNQNVWNRNQYQTPAPSRYNLKDLTDRLQQYQNNALGNSNSSLNSGLNNGSIFSPNNMQSLNLNVSSALYPQQNSFNTYSQPYQLAQNSLPNSGSDVGNMSTGNFSPEVFKERMLPVIRNMEQPLDYIYIDTTWNKTTGAGANVDDWDTFNQINWMVNGRPATEAEKRAVFNIFQNEINQARQNRDSEGNIIKNNKKASSYIDYSQFRLAKGEVDRLLRNHITEDIKYLQKEFPDFCILSTGVTKCSLGYKI